MGVVEEIEGFKEGGVVVADGDFYIFCVRQGGTKTEAGEVNCGEESILKNSLIE